MNPSQSSDHQPIVTQLAQRAREASRNIAALTTAQKNDALQLMADEINSHQQQILTANQHDLDAAKQNHLEASLVDRLELNAQRIQQMVDQLDCIIELEDPIGEMTFKGIRPSGINLSQLRVPIGVIGIIYESRPNVTLDAASLCFKTANACILRGGKEALHSNLAISSAIQKALKRANIDPYAVQVVDNTDRDIMRQLISDARLLDLVIPRGGTQLIQFISEHATVPVLKHLHGNCHVFVDAEADLAMAAKICENAKTRRYGVCNAMESLLVHEQIAAEFIPKLMTIMKRHSVEVRGCHQSQGFDKRILAANEVDYSTEYLAPVLSIKVIDSLDDAIQHINEYGSGHTDAIITNNNDNANQFLRLVDSSSVMHNTSTAFADGFEYGLGAEIGISTDKLHARGPVGLEGLTSLKYVVSSDGAIRSVS